MIKPQVIEDIKIKADIVAVVGRYVQLKKKGRNFTGLCPFHKEKTPSFIVSPEKNICHCFGCGEGGNVFNFVMKIENVSFVESVKILGEMVGIEVEEDQWSPQHQQQKEETDLLLEINQKAAELYKKQVTSLKAAEYLKQRGLPAETILKFELGYAPESWSFLLDNLTGYPPALLEKAGLVLAKEKEQGYYDRFRDRLMFPVKDLRGRVIAFSGRILTDDSKQAKYVNSPETLIYNKGSHLYGLDLAKDEVRRNDAVILVEGQMDVIAAHAAGLLNTVASLGTAFTVNQARLLARYTKNIIIAYDNDNAGQIASERVLEILLPLNFNIRIMKMADKDIDEMIKIAGAESVKKAATEAEHFMRFKLDRILEATDITDIAGRSQAVKEALKELVKVKDDEVMLDHYLEYFGARVKLNKEILREELLKPFKFSFRKERKTTVITKPLHKYQKAQYYLICYLLENPAERAVLLSKINIVDFPEAYQDILKVLQQNDKSLDELITNDSIEEGVKKKIRELAVRNDNIISELSLTEVLVLLEEKNKNQHKEQLRSELINAREEGNEQREEEIVTELMVLMKEDKK